MKIKTTDHEIRIRISQETLELLKRAQMSYNLKPSETVRVALRRYLNLNPDLSAVDMGSTTRGYAMTFNLLQLPIPTHEDFRRIVLWHLRSLPYPKRAPLQTVSYDSLLF